MNKYRSIDNAHKNIFVVLCGRMTPDQKQIVRREAEMDTQVFLNLLNWFIKESGHPAYRELTPPEQCPDPVIVLQDEETENNTDDPVDPHVECRVEGKTYYFSNESQAPNESNSVFDSNKEFLNAMLNSNTPTLLMYGGSYLKAHEINLEDAFPIQFPFGIGGPNPSIARKVPVSTEACLDNLDDGWMDGWTGTIGSMGTMRSMDTTVTMGTIGSIETMDGRERSDRPRRWMDRNNRIDGKYEISGNDGNDGDDRIDQDDGSTRMIGSTETMDRWE